MKQWFDFYRFFSGQRSTSGQLSHLCGLAGQYSRPKFIRRCEKSIHFSLGTIFMRSCSIFTGSMASVSPNLRERRMTWVSTTIPSAL